MNVIIFSKDRAAQLDLLIYSMVMNNYEVPAKVLYTFSNDRFVKGYDLIHTLAGLYANCAELIKQSDCSFKSDLLELINKSEQFTVFFTDDDVFIAPLLKYPYIPHDVGCLSLRLNPHMTYCYTLNRAQKIPPFVAYNHIEHTYTWEWRGADADYGYPMSLNGHIFRTADILPLLKKLDYTNPNELEGQLARHPINRPKMMCFDKSVIVNNPINRVQNTVPNRHGDITAEWLNEQFLQGKRIKLEPFLGYEPNACHVELPIIME